MVKYFTLALGLVIMFPCLAHADRLWSSGFELQSMTSAMEWDVVTNSPTIDTTTKLSGEASMRCNVSATTAYVNQQFSSGTSGSTYWRFYVYVSSAPSSQMSIMRFHSSSFGNIVSVRMNTNRTLELWNDSDVLQIGSATSALNTATWYRIETSFTGNDTWAMRIDGTQVISDTNAGLYASPSLDSIDIGCITTSTADLYFDDYAVNDSTGSSQTTYPGAGSIVHMQPSGSAGDNNGANAGNCASVDEVTPDDASTIANLDANNDIIDCPGEGSSSAGIDSYDTITLVQIGARHAENPSGTGSLIYHLRIKSASGGTTVDGTSVTHNDGTYRTNGDNVPRNYSLTSYTDPTTAIAWTPTGTNSLDNMQMGMYAEDASPDIGLSTLWALVEYVDGSPPGGGSLVSHAKLSGGSIRLRGGKFKLITQ